MYINHLELKSFRHYTYVHLPTGKSQINFYYEFRYIFQLIKITQNCNKGKLS